MTTNIGFVVIIVAQPAVVLLTLAPVPWDRMKVLSKESTRYASGGYRLLEYLQCRSLRCPSDYEGSVNSVRYPLLGTSEGLR